MSNLTEKSPEFYPPQPNPIVIGFCQSILPLVARWIYKMKVEIDEKELQKLIALENERMVFLPNHVMLPDWITIGFISLKIKGVFYYLAAYESFKGIVGKFLQSLGVYSVKRGMADRTSIAYTLELLRQPQARLVIFPEGGCSYQNDTVMPFRPGAIQLPFQAMKKMTKDEDLPSFYLVPISIKYKYTGEMSSVIDRTLSNLEAKLNINKKSDDNYQRLRDISERVLLNLESEYKIDNKEVTGKEWNERIDLLKNHALENCEQQLDITPPNNSPIRERVYKIQYTLNSRAESELPDRGYWTYRSIYKTTVRLLNFNAIYDGYVAEEPTPERFMDTLTRLEREVFETDQPSPKAPRKAYIRIGDPIDLKDYFEAYKQNKVTTIENLREQVQQIVKQNLHLT
ncbi:MAG: 1-acyl-sn-glycerol-3-phosphate acyltransferase [Prochloraceae cyanobacterium]